MPSERTTAANPITPPMSFILHLLGRAHESVMPLKIDPGKPLHAVLLIDTGELAKSSRRFGNWRSTSRARCRSRSRIPVAEIGPQRAAPLRKNLELQSGRFVGAFAIHSRTAKRKKNMKKRTFLKLSG